MPEMQPRSTQEHLDSISSRGNHAFRQHVESQMHRVHEGEMLPVYNAEQPMADRVLHSLARATDIAHEQLQAKKSFFDANHETIWMKSLDILKDDAIQKLNESKESITSEESSEADEAVMALLVAAALDETHQTNHLNQNPSVLEAVIAAGYAKQIEASANSALTRGLVVLTSNDECVPVYDIATKALGTIQNNQPSEIISHGEANEILENNPLESFTESLRTTREKAGHERAKKVPYEKHFNDLYKLVNEYGIPYHFSMSAGLSAVLEEGEYTPAQFSGLLKELHSASEYLVKRIEELGYTGFDLYGDAPMSMLNHVPDVNLKEAYFSQKDKDSGALKYLLTQRAEAGDHSIASKGAEVLARLFDDDALGMASNTEAMQDPIARKMIERKDYSLVALDSIPNRKSLSESSQEYTIKVRDLSEEFLTSTLGLPVGLADDIRRALRERTMFKDRNGLSRSGDDACVDPITLKSNLARIASVVEAVGVENLQHLREACGIINLDNYSAEQLTRMNRLLQKDAGTIDHLKNGDVTVVFTDAKGDHNGAMSDNANKFEVSSGRSLYFEISRPSDFYRHMAFLKKRGIKPSTIVVATHGSPGAMGFGDEDNEFYLSNLLPEKLRKNAAEHGVSVVPLLEAEGVPRLVEEYMQDSRGIDDDELSVGRRKIILKSCSQAKPRRVEREIDGQIIEVEESTAQTLAAKLSPATHADIYGANKVVATVNTPKGVRYMEKDERGAFNVVVPATRYSRDAMGNLVETTVDEIILRKEAA